MSNRSYNGLTAQIQKPVDEDGFQIVVYRDNKPVLWSRIFSMKHALKSVWKNMTNDVAFCDLVDTTNSIKGGADRAKRSAATKEGWKERKLNESVQERI